jgi:hypothetical protein
MICSSTDQGRIHDHSFRITRRDLSPLLLGGRLASTLSLSSQLRLWPAFEQIADPLRGRLGGDELRGCERATVSLASKRKVIG